MIREVKLFLRSAFPGSSTAYAKAKEKILSSYNGDQYLGTVFSSIFRRNDWSNAESRSGRLSTVEATSLLRQQLPALVERLEVKTLLDAPCGDFNWMQHTDLGLDRYIGADIVPDLVEHNRMHHSRKDREFIVLDIAKDPLPRVDLILCRDCLIHLSFRYATAAIENFKASKSLYLLTTTYPTTQSNRDIRTGDCRIINLRLPPFNFPPPLQSIMEEPESSKSLALWRLGDL